MTRKRLPLGAPAALPLVEFTLQRLYDEFSVEKTLTVEMYEEVGGITGAVEKCLRDSVGTRDQGAAMDIEAVERADKVWEQRFAPLFEELVNVNEAEVGTRRRARIETIKKTPEAWKRAQELREARLLVTNEQTIEVAHEALFTAWKSLNRWIERREVALREWRNMEFAAAEWRRRGRPDYAIWAYERLKAFERDTAGLGRTPTATEQAFLKSEIDRLLEELENLDTSHGRRADIGNRLSLLGDPRPGLGFRDDGTPDISKEDYWCPVPQGTVNLADEAGAFEVKPCYIARYPVTRAQFRAFQIAYDGYKNPDWWTDLQQAELELQPEEGCYRPATDVSWYDAIAFCRWLSARLRYQVILPTEWLWEQAATGGDPHRKFPWLGEWVGRKANTYGCALSHTTAVGMYPGGAALNGALDIAGNVWEWCLNKDNPADDQTIDKSGERRVLRGGSCDNDDERARCHSRLYFGPDYRHDSIGIRLSCSSPSFVAQPKKVQTTRAKKHFDRGRAAFEAEDYATAIKEYEQTHEIIPQAAGLLFNIAQCHRNLEHHAKAAALFKRYLDAAPEATNRASVERLIEELEAKAAIVTVSVGGVSSTSGGGASA